MSEDADWDIEDIPCNVRDLLPTDIGKEVDKPELYCKLCKVQTTSFGNFRDHLKGKGHKNALEAFRQGKKVIGKRKRTAVSLSEIGQKSISMEMVEGLTEPIVGLSYITEYHSFSGIVCVCNLCGVKFDRNVVVSHVTGSKHRLHYMKEMKPFIYLQVKNFGGKKSQLSVYLEKLSMDAEKEDGRGIPTIKIFELRDSSHEIEDKKFSEDKDIDDAYKAFGFHETLLACRKPGAVTFQDWVNEEFNKLNTDNVNCLPLSSCAASENLVGDNSGNSATIHGNPVYYNTASSDMYRSQYLAYDSYHYPQHYQQYPYPYSMQDGSYYSFSQPFPSPDSVSQTPLGIGFSCPEPHLDSKSCMSVSVVETYPDPNPNQNIPPKTDAMQKDTITFAEKDDGRSDKADQKEFCPKSVLIKKSASDSEKSADQIKPGPDQCEKDVQEILGQNTNIQSPDSSPMLSSTYLSPEKSPSLKKGSELKKPRELPFSKSYLETNKLIKDSKLARKLPFSKSYLESHKLKVSKAHRDQKTSDKTISSKINLLRSGHRSSGSPNKSHLKPVHKTHKSSSPDYQKCFSEHYNYNRHRPRDYEFGDIRSRSPEDPMGGRERHTDDKSKSSPKPRKKRSKILENVLKHNRSKDRFSHHKTGRSYESNASKRNSLHSSKHRQTTESPTRSIKLQHSSSPEATSSYQRLTSPPLTIKEEFIESPEAEGQCQRTSQGESQNPLQLSELYQFSRSPLASSSSYPLVPLELPQPTSPEASKTPPVVIKQEFIDSPENRQSRLIQDLLSETDAELQAEKIADLLFQMSDGDLIQSLLANADVQETLLASKGISD